MAIKTTNTTFNINIPSINLEDGESIIFKLQCENSSVTNFTASIAQGSLKISSLAASTGYTTTNIPFFNSASIALSSNTNEIILSSGISGFHGGDYIFVPNPLGGTENGIERYAESLTGYAPTITVSENSVILILNILRNNCYKKYY